MITIRPGAHPHGPTVVFISQLGTAGTSWNPVIQAMTSRAATVTYDRPGTGDCPPRPAPNPPLPYSAHATELAHLLTEHGVNGPLIVVGHSVGSLIARMFIDHHPTRIAGIVHVDGSLPRLTLWPAVDHQDIYDGDGPDATAFDILAGEAEILAATIPDVPAAIIARTPGRWSPAIPFQRCDPLWTAHQRQLAHLHHAPLITAPDAGHQIPAEAPALVAATIDRVLRTVSPVARSSGAADR